MARSPGNACSKSSCAAKIRADGNEDVIIIVGAGIGGLAAALALASRGREVTLVERRTGFGELGAGLQLSPNASRLLSAIGLGAALRRIAVEPERIVVRASGTGREIGGFGLKPTMRERFGAPYCVVQRAELHTALLDAVRARPSVRFLVGRKAMRATSAPDGATLVLETEAGSREELRGHAVIGADGVRSVIRRSLDDHRLPMFRGSVAWRATIPRDAAPPELRGDETGLWLGRDGHVVHYPIAGGDLVNLVVVRRAREPVDGWSAPGDPAEIRAAFADAAPALRALIEAPAEWLRWSLLDLPCRTMAKGRLALLGDAAHPVLPFLAQGAALAIEDAVCLAERLGGGLDVPEALASYARQRQPRAKRVQDASRANGRTYHAGWPLSAGRDLVLRRMGPEGMAERYAWLYGWRPDTNMT